jgi:hypothetical protein
MADEYATSLAGNTWSDIYYQAMWDYSSQFTLQLFQRASLSLSSLIYSAWVKAGKPLMDPNAIYERELSSPVMLLQNFPNPVISTTTISFEVTEPNTLITLEIFDITGVKITTLLDTRIPSGYQELEWDATGVDKGIYLCVLKAESALLTRKLIVMN